MLTRFRRADQAGFTMIEVLLALTLFGLLAGTVAATLGSILSKARNNQDRTIAANVATRLIDRLHAIPAGQLPDGQMVPQTVRSAGNVFTATITTSLVGEGASLSDSACDSGGALSARRISVVVTWVDMGSIRPVRSDTLRQLTVGEVDPTKGVAAVKVVDRNAKPAANQVVTLNPGNLQFTTGDDGCAVFSKLTPGSYTVSLATAGYVDQGGLATPARGITVAAGAVTKDPGFVYDRAASLALSYFLPVGDSATSYPPLPSTGVTLGNAAFTGNSRSYPVCTATTAYCAALGGAGIVTGLFPSPQGYLPWAGACADASSATSPASVVLNAGQMGTASVPLARVEVFVVDKNNPVADAVQITHGADGGCPVGSSGSLTSGPTSNRIAVGLPSGTWTFTYSTAGNKGKSQTITATKVLIASPTAPLTTVTLFVP